MRLGPDPLLQKWPGVGCAQSNRSVDEDLDANETVTVRARSRRVVAPFISQHASPARKAA
jgi:hypothetical protein